MEKKPHSDAGTQRNVLIGTRQSFVDQNVRIPRHT
jgi:hypothetical protein